MPTVIAQMKLSLENISQNSKFQDDKLILGLFVLIWINVFFMQNPNMAVTSSMVLNFSEQLNKLIFSTQNSVK